MDRVCKCINLTKINNLSGDIYAFFHFAGMAFPNFVVSGGAKEVNFLPREPRGFSYGIGSPSMSVNNHDANASLDEVKSTPLVPVNTEENPFIVEDVGDSDDPPSNDNQVANIGSSNIAGRVCEWKGTSAKAPKLLPKRKLDILVPTSRIVKQKDSHGKAIVSEDP